MRAWEVFLTEAASDEILDRIEKLIVMQVGDGVEKMPTDKFLRMLNLDLDKRSLVNFLQDQDSEMIYDANEDEIQFSPAIKQPEPGEEPKSSEEITQDLAIDTALDNITQ